MQAYPESRETFADVLIEPAYSDILHRGKVDTASWIGRLRLDLPIFSANMRHITEAKMCKAMSEWGASGIIHRFMTVEQAVSEYKLARKLCGGKAVIGVSLGVNEVDKERFAALREAGAGFFCIDVAHGHHVLVKNMLQWIRKETDCDKKKAPVLMAGNIATWEAAMDLYGWGADIVKAGIGPGSSCATRKNAGVGVPQLYAIRTIREKTEKSCHIPLVSDGGISDTGDIPKALKYADAVMVARLVAGTAETPGLVYENERGELYKVFGGSASGENKVATGQDNNFVEGNLKLVPFIGHVKYVLKKSKEMVQTSFSYVGARNINEFRKNAQLYRHTSGSRIESKI